MADVSMTVEGDDPGVVELNWSVTEKYHRSFTPNEWATFVQGLRHKGEPLPTGTDDASLDTVYTWLENESFDAVTALNDIATPSYWYDTDTALATDLTFKR